jgi:uracil-DNA glycosylase
MNENTRKRAAAFIKQRMEMGETVWFFRSEEGLSESPSHDMPYIPVREPLPIPSGVKKVSGAIEKGMTVSTGLMCGKSLFGTDEIASQKSLEQLHDAVCGCLRCPLGKTRTHFVFGMGNPNADIMFIGEAPGGEEDAQGLPFVGRAGKLLTRMIEAMKLNRSDVYIGNILKCRPPENRDPLQLEIDTCEPILIRQIEIIHPKIICALGRISGQTLLRTKAALGALRGKVHNYQGIKLIVTYHPAALLRNPHWKPQTWEDLKFLRRLYDGVEL